MTEQLKANVASLRLYIRQLREAHFKARFAGGVHSWRYDPMRRDRVLHTQGRLSYLVPLYRALSAAVQQQKDGMGASLYKKRFAALRELLGKLGDSTSVGSNYHTYLGDDVLGLQIPVPAECHSPVCWKFQSIGELLADVKVQLEAEKQAALERSRTADEARKFFLGSLNVGQRTLLKAALIAAKAKGAQAIIIHERDLEAL